MGRKSRGLRGKEVTMGAEAAGEPGRDAEVKEPPGANGRYQR
jgi:hypothetical protein